VTTDAPGVFNFPAISVKKAKKLSAISYQQEIKKNIFREKI
jgi:hypothetical protein